MAEALKATDIRIIRLLDAPVRAVWDAWTDPKQVADWWGPRGYSITDHSRDTRAGGSWRFTMHGPNQVDYPNLITYIEVTPLKRLVYDHGSPEAPQPAFRTTVEFTEQHGKTLMDMTMTLPSVEAATATRKFVKEANGETTWDRLAEFLAKKIVGREQFVINRSFPVSVSKMFEIWTDAKHLAQWLPPTGATVQFLRADIRPGGSNFYVMPMPNGVKMYGRSSYVTIERPNQIVYTQQFCDEHEKIVRHPMASTWPLTMRTTVTFAPEEGGHTRVSLIWEPDGQVLPEELATFIHARAGMTQGWTGSFDKLEAYVDAIKSGA